MFLNQLQVVLFLFAAALTIVCERLPDATEGYPYIKYAFLANAILTTVVCKCIIACLLYRQSKTKFWTNHFLKQVLLFSICQLVIILIFNLFSVIAGSERRKRVRRVEARAKHAELHC
jgi:predicted membrane protein